MNVRLYISMCLLAAFPLITNGQDAVFSHVDANRLYYNPAYTGIDQGLRLAAGYRRQWPGIVSDFSSFNFSAEAQAFNIAGGIGLMFSKSREGEGYYTRTKAGFLYTYQIVTRNYQLSMGTRVSSVTHSIDWSRLQFSDQLDPVLGPVNPTAAVAPETPYRNFVDFDWGAMLRFRNRIGLKSMNNTFGIAWIHSTEPDESIMNVVSRLPSKVSVQAATVITRRGDRSGPRFGFSYLGEWQNRFSSMTLGANFMTRPMYFGLSYRSKLFVESDALIVYVGLFDGFTSERSYRLMYSYDLTVSGLTLYSGGTHEISIVVNLDDVNLFKLRSGAARRKFSNCFRFKDGSMPVVF